MTIEIIAIQPIYSCQHKRFVFVTLYNSYYSMVAAVVCTNCTMFAEVLELCSLNVHTVNVCKHTTHGRVDLPSLSRCHPREGGVFEDTPIHVPHEIEWSPYDTKEVWICAKVIKKEKKTNKKARNPRYLSSSHSEKRCGTGMPASLAAFFTLNNKLDHMISALRSHDYKMITWPHYIL